MAAFMSKGCDTSTTGADKWGQVTWDKDETQMVKNLQNDYKITLCICNYSQSRYIDYAWKTHHYTLAIIYSKC